MSFAEKREYDQRQQRAAGKQRAAPEDPDGAELRAVLECADALDMEYVLDATIGDYGGANPDELEVKVCSKGCMYGHASAYLQMAGKLGWAKYS